MLVKCINNEGDSRLRLGDIYIINYKLLNSKSMTLVGMGGNYLINRFIDENNNKIKNNFSFFNKRYNPPFNRSRPGEFGYAMPIPNKLLKSLERKIYKISSMRTKSDPTSRTGRSIKQIRVDGRYGWFNSKNFLFFTHEEGKAILREEKIEKIINTNKK